MENQHENLERVSLRIAPSVREFCRERVRRKNRQFHADELRERVSATTGINAPASADRVLRHLRQKNVLNYRILNRRESLYEVLWVDAPQMTFELEKSEESERAKMICPTCQTELPPLALACAVCMRVKLRTDLENSEIQLTPKILNGELDLKLLRSGKIRHLGFHDGFRNNPYCDADLRSPLIGYVKFLNRPDNICSHCASMLKTFAKKAGVIPAR